MKIVRRVLLFTITSLPLLAVKTGDTYDQVMAEMGKPSNQLEMGGVLILNYPNQRIKLKDKVVVAVATTAPEPPPSTVVPAPAPKPRVTPPAAPAVPSSVELKWTTDYKSALSEARQSQAKVFLFFTGSDWCGWCMRLDREILSTQEFKSYADRKLILVKLDFPRKTPLSAELKAQNKRLAGQYGITGYPTVVVLNSQGRQVAELGYQEGGPGPFIAALEKR